MVYDKFKLAAYVHSAALAMPRDDTPMTRAGRQGRAGGARRQRHAATGSRPSSTIPGRASLRFSDARMTVVDNARYEPEQILLLTSSSPVAERAFGGKMSVSCCRCAIRSSRRRTATVRLARRESRSATTSSRQSHARDR